MKTGIFVLTLSLFLFSNTSWAQPQSIQTQVVIEDPRIGLVQGIDLDSEQNVYVGDLLNNRVHRYRSNGEYDRSFGRSGRGPGEFQAISGMRIGGDDSLYTYDLRSRRLTVYTTKTSTNPRTTSLPPGPERLEPSATGTLYTGIEGLWLTQDGRSLVSYKRPINPMEESGKGRPLQIRNADSPTRAAPVLEMQARQMLSLKGKGGAMLTVMPFGRKPIVEMGPENRIYFGESDSLVIRRKPIGGKRQTVVSREFSKVDLTEDLLRTRLEMGGNQDLLKNFDMVWAKAPSHVPVFEDFTVDGDERIWVAVNTSRALEGGHTEYWIFGPDGDLVRKVRFDRLVFLKEFSGQNVYGIATKPNGVQQIVRASLDTLLSSFSRE